MEKILKKSPFSAAWAQTAAKLAPMKEALVAIANDRAQEDPKVSKRSSHLPWDDYFMAVALLSAQRSKDPNTQVGACIVNRQKRIVGVGYNGFPTGCSDDDLPWGRKGDYLDTKYPYVCHAELNAVLNSVPGNLVGCTIYTALFPCNECAKVIIQAGIREVVYLSDKYADTDSVRAARRMFGQAGVVGRQLTPTQAKVTVRLDIA